MKLSPLAIDGAGPLDGHILCIDAIDQRPVAVLQSRVPLERDGIDRVIVLALTAAQQLTACYDMQRNVALQLQRPDREYAGGTNTVPPPSPVQASTAACNAAVSSVVPSPLAP